MKLNPDCIRDVLLDVEEKCDYINCFEFPDDSNRLKSYDRNTALYHIKQCDRSGLITGFKTLLNTGCLIGDLSPSGHEFLSNIRSETTWNATKEITKKIGTDSLSAMLQVASGIVAEIIKNYLGIH
jgi:hypothetical protein